MNKISLNKLYYDPFIDFIKAYSILVVVFCHGFPYLSEAGYAIWGVQIPLFFLIQVFHCYKREARPVNWKMIGRRIILPFMVIESVIFCIMLFTDAGGGKIIVLLKYGLSCGGFGPGSYYPWVYFQMAIFIPIIRPICEKLGMCSSFFFFILLSVALEIGCSLINLPDFIYRLLCIRYIFLIWIGWIWIKEGILFNALTIIASLISLLAIVYFAYFGRNLAPLFYNTGWTTHRWVCYFWVGFIYVGILHIVYRNVVKFEVVAKSIRVLASASYEIFLVQMVYYAVVKPGLFSFVGNQCLQFVLWFSLAFVLSLIGGISMNKYAK